MFNLGSKEILIIALIIFFLFGSKKLTEWAKGLGDASRELKKAKREFSNAIDETDRDIKKTFDLSEENKTDQQGLPPDKSKKSKVKEVTKNKYA